MHQLDMLSSGAAMQGRVFTDSGLPGLQPSERLAVYAGMARTLAALHSVQPDRVGLSGYGRTTGYCARQVIVAWIGEDELNFVWWQLGCSSISLACLLCSL